MIKAKVYKVGSHWCASFPTNDPWGASDGLHRSYWPTFGAALWNAVQAMRPERWSNGGQ